MAIGEITCLGKLDLLAGERRKVEQPTRISEQRAVISELFGRSALGWKRKSSSPHGAELTSVTGRQQSVPHSGGCFAGVREALLAPWVGFGSAGCGAELFGLAREEMEDEELRATWSRASICRRAAAERAALRGARRSARSSARAVGWIRLCRMRGGALRGGAGMEEEELRTAWSRASIFRKAAAERAALRGLLNRRRGRRWWRRRCGRECSRG